MAGGGNVYLPVKHANQPYRKEDNSMKTRTAILTVLLFSLLLGMGTVSFADGTDANASEIHACNGVSFDTPLQGSIKDSIPEGNYFLTGDCQTVNRIVITGNVSICLNGYTFFISENTFIQVKDGGTLSLYNCGEEGYLGSRNNGKIGQPVSVAQGGTLNLYSADIRSYWGPFAVENSGTFNVYGGGILCDGVASDGNGIKNLGTVNFYGGSIDAVIGVIMRQDGTSCNFLDGTTVINVRNKAFDGLSEMRTVNVIAGDEPVEWRMNAQSPMSKKELPDGKALEQTAYFELHIGTEEEKPEETATSDSAAGTAETGEKDSDFPESDLLEQNNTAPAESIPNSTEEAAVREPVDFIAESLEKIRPELYTATDSPSGGFLAYMFFGTVAAASLAVIILMILKNRKEK